ncbi:MAG: PilZ domain-containing protein [Treponema sp.]|jgi:hypothetical protein|nr:PilZ domain-containing protein [Treponema sp.]
MALFKKKKEAAVSSAKEKPRAPRYECKAYIRINGLEGQAVLRNISIGGFQMESKIYALLEEGRVYHIFVAPKDFADVASFEVNVEIRWVQISISSFTVGLAVIPPILDKNFEKYIEYITLYNRKG